MMMALQTGDIPPECRDGSMDTWCGSLRLPCRLRYPEVRMLSWMPGTPGEDARFAVRITDKDLGLIWEASLPSTLFTADTMVAAERSWLEVVVPGVTVNGDFCVQLYAPTLGQGLGPYIGTDTSSINEHSEMILGWQATEWFGQMPEGTTNWMIRVEGTVQ